MSGNDWTLPCSYARFARPFLLGAAAAACGLTGGAALAQAGGNAQATVSRPVVQPIPGGDGRVLNAALARLAKNPRDAEALIDAGNAALKMGDADAASGFYRRAEQVAPGNARAKAGLAGALVRGGNPFDAIPLFQQAEQGGALDGTLAADRGLAYDLVGDNASAQRYYRMALARGADDEVTRRLALSQAIAGDRKGAEATLTPLLRQQDKAAWRTRAFSLAIAGDVDQSITIAKTILPPNLASAIAPYLRYMPRLTRAQQAAAATFGAFPRASEIGQDDPRVALYAPTGPSRPALASADAAPAPRSEPSGKRSRSRARARPARDPAPARQTRTFAVRSGEVVRVAPPDVKPAIEIPAAQPAGRAAKAKVAAATPPARPASTPAPASRPMPAPAPASTPRPTGELPPVASTGAAPVASRPAQPQSPQPQPTPAPPTAMPPAQSMASPVVASGNPLPTATAPMPGFDTVGPPRPADLPPVASASSAPAAPLAPAATPAPAPAPAPASAPPVERVSLAEAFREFGTPAADVTPREGAVDIRHIAPARPKPAVAEVRKPAPPSHPSRIWVQIATGRDKGALAFDWRRMTRQNADVFKGKKAFVSDWGQTNRLLTGPFDSANAASTFLTQLRRAGIDGPFVWTSPAGQVVDTLP